MAISTILPYHPPSPLVKSHLSTTTKLSFQRNLIPQRSQQKRTWRVLVAPEQALSSDNATSSPIETAQEIVSSSGDDGTGTIIQVLLLIAFVALSILHCWGDTYRSDQLFGEVRGGSLTKKRKLGRKRRAGRKGRSGQGLGREGLVKNSMMMMTMMMILIWQMLRSEDCY